MCSFLLELQVHSVELSSSFGKRQKTLGPWLILLKLNILLEPATQTTSHGIIPEIEEEVAAARALPAGSCPARGLGVTGRGRARPETSEWEDEGWEEHSKRKAGPFHGASDGVSESKSEESMRSGRTSNKLMTADDSLREQWPSKSRSESFRI